MNLKFEIPKGRSSSLWAAFSQVLIPDKSSSLAGETPEV
jgi:hypothetical protein